MCIQEKEKQKNYVKGINIVCVNHEYKYISIIVFIQLYKITFNYDITP